jgi:hypothetical protein
MTGTSLLAPEAQEAKTILDGLVADPNSAYWKGAPDRGVSAAELQQEYQNLIRAELSGAPHAVGPPGGVDVDLPATASHYDISAAPGARSAGAADRDIIDAFLPAAYAAGLGQRKVAEAVGFALTHVRSESVEFDFAKFAMGRGWSHQAINFCLEWARKYQPGARAAAAAPAARAAVADERAEIEKLMGDPRSEYWRGPKAATMQARYRELVRGG